MCVCVLKREKESNKDRETEKKHNLGKLKND